MFDPAWTNDPNLYITDMNGSFQATNMKDRNTFGNNVDIDWTAYTEAKRTARSPAMHNSLAIHHRAPNLLQTFGRGTISTFAETQVIPQPVHEIKDANGTGSPRQSCCCDCHKARTVENDWNSSNLAKSSTSDQYSIHASEDASTRLSTEEGRTIIHKNLSNNFGFDTNPTWNILLTGVEDRIEELSHQLFQLSHVPEQLLVKTVKEGPGGLYCGLPGCTNPVKVFQTVSTVLEHMQQDDKPFWCICNTQFATKCIGSRHVKEGNEGYKFNCPICPRRYKRKTQLRDHLKLKHKNL